MTTPLDDALDKLFAAPLGEFMATRETLAKELRTAGHKEAAATVKGQHKPTVAAHALNRLARDAGPELCELFEASRELASGKDFKNALERQRAALEAVRAKVHPAEANTVVSVVRGAMVDEALAKQVRAGRFSKVPEVQVGFFGAAPQGDERVTPAKSKVKKTEREAPLPAIDRTELTRARAAREKEKQDAEREKAAQEKLARERAERFEREVAAAEQEAARLSAEADVAEREAMDARRRAREAAARVKEIKSRRWDHDGWAR